MSLSKLFYRLTDAIGERLYRRGYRKQYGGAVPPTKEDRARVRSILENIERRANNERYFDIDEDHCACPKVCEVHP